MRQTLAADMPAAGSKRKMDFNESAEIVRFFCVLQGESAMQQYGCKSADIQYQKYT